MQVDQARPASSDGWGHHGWFYISVRISLFLWVMSDCQYSLYLRILLAFIMFSISQLVLNTEEYLLCHYVTQVALLNLITISSTWARVIDVMDSEVSMLCFSNFCCLMVT